MVNDIKIILTSWLVVVVLMFFGVAITLNSHSVRSTDDVAKNNAAKTSKNSAKVDEKCSTGKIRN